MRHVTLFRATGELVSGEKCPAPRLIAQPLQGRLTRREDQPCRNTRAPLHYGLVFDPEPMKDVPQYFLGDVTRGQDVDEQPINTRRVTVIKLIDRRRPLPLGACQQLFRREFFTHSAIAGADLMRHKQLTYSPPIAVHSIKAPGRLVHAVSRASQPAILPQRPCSAFGNSPPDLSVIC